MTTNGKFPRSMTTLSATGALGHEPIHPGSFYEGIKRHLDFIGADAGSGDSGPYFLGADAPMNPEEWEKHDLDLLLVAARGRHIPLIIGSAGGCGSNRGVDDYTRIVKEIAAEHRLEPFRLARAEMLVEKTREYAEAARALGARDARLIARHLLPNIVHTILVLATLRTGYFIIMEASLSFLGLGIQPPTPAWGGMVADGRSFMLDAWWIATFPGLALLLLVLALNTLGEGLRDILDPRLRGTG